MKIFFRASTVLALILFFACQSFACAAEKKSFVDEMIYETLPFEENPADEFFAEKREINQLCKPENMEDTSASFYQVSNKIQDLKAKSRAKYGKNYEDPDWIFATNKLWAINFDVYFSRRLQERFVSYGVELDAKLADENTWREIETEIQNAFKSTKIPIEIHFRTDKKFVSLCEELLGDAHPITLRHTINLIHDYSVLGDSKTALSMAKKFLPKVEKVFGKNSREVAELLTLMANDYATLGNYRAGEETLRKAIDVNRQLHGDETSPELIANLVALAKLNPSAANMEALDEAAKNFSEDDLYRLGYFRVKILNSNINNVKKHVELIKSFNKEIDFVNYHHIDGYMKRLDMSLEQSESAEALGLYSQSLTWNLSAMEACKGDFGNYHHKTLVTMCNLSNDYLMLNQPEDALILAQRAFDTSKKIYGEEHPCTIYAIHRLTNVYRKTGNFSDALTLDKKAHELSRKVFVKNSANETPETMKILADLADDYAGLKNFPSAIKHYKEFLSKCNTTNAHASKIADVRKNLAHLYNVAGEHEKTVELYDFLRANDSYSLDGLAVDGLVAAHTADVLGAALTALGKDSNALNLYSQEIRELERVRFYNTILSSNENRQEWFSEMVPCYKKTASFFVRQNEAEQAFRAVEFCKARTLADQYGDLLATYKGGLTDEDISTLNEHLKEISRYKEFIAKNDALKFNFMWSQLRAASKYASYRLELRKKYPEYEKALLKGSRFFNPEQIEALLPKINGLLPADCCYISFSAAPNELLVIVADASGKIQAVKIPVDEKFFDDCKLYHDLISYPDINSMSEFGKKYLWQIGDEYKITDIREKTVADENSVKDDSKFIGLRQKLCAELSEKLLPTLERFAGKFSYWIISPDAELNLVPFETLTYRGKFLVDEKNVSYVPSLAVMNLMRNRERKNSYLGRNKELFAMGDAIYGDNDETATRGSFDENSGLASLKWSNLPGAAHELDKVSALFESKNIFRREQASEKNLRQLNSSGELSQYKYLLFSAHGIFVPQRPELSSIVLSQNFDADFDGYVTVGEWMSYDLRSDLIYLSACESGRGSYQAGEGIVGIPYALTVAGNKDTVMSLWKVNDAATAEFTSAVFEKLSRGKSEVDAINETKREFLSNPIYRDPSIWAAFVLYGI